MTVGLLGNLFSEALLLLTGESSITLIDQEELNITGRHKLRLYIAINHLAMFTLGGLVFLKYFYHDANEGRLRSFDDGMNFLNLKSPPLIMDVLLWAFIILASYPVVGGLTQLNELLPIPEWGRSGQEMTFDFMKKILEMNGLAELVFCLVLVGMLPAIGEELVFRGILQQKLSNSTSSIAAILISAVAFGLVHGQLVRVIPLSFLGAILGLSYHYTQRLWVPVILHFCNNAIQVISIYILGEAELDNISEAPESNLIVVLFSLLIVTALLFYAHKHYKRYDELRP